MTDTASATHRQAVLRAEGLRVEYRRAGHPSVIAVDGVTFSIEEGRCLALVGESGSGKSSVAMATMGFAPVTDGTLEVLGHDVADFSTRRGRRRRTGVQMVFQDPQASLDPRQSVASGLAELRRLHAERCVDASDEELLRRVGLPADALVRYPHQLSGGQIQRIVLARALMLQPKLLVADEPTSGLDVTVQQQVIALLRRLIDETGVAVLFITHNLPLVTHIAEETAVMASGKICEIGPADAVLRHPEHAYTRTLLAASPGQAMQRRLAVRDSPAKGKHIDADDGIEGAVR
ncbi:ABC transporter ATP-binding protein [Acrocarpospora pleiomorpha]|uniref:ABC transporter ATP-binding protein n=1 Tax=Acrocarpospora pleiomorpha TaxID=90975 RepID=UPI001478289A|nr:ABC transporter ATP-binding protein [Acrocarpospora pleiomorpha]